MRTGLMVVVAAVLAIAFSAGEAQAVTCTTPANVPVRTGQATKIPLSCGPGYAQATVTHQPQHGTLTLGMFGAPFTYTPNAGYRGPDSFSYTANSGSPADDSAEVTQAIVVSDDANQAPTCPTFSPVPTVRVGHSVTLTVACTDPNDDPLTMAVTTAPAHGTLGAFGATGGTMTVAYTATSPGDDTLAYRADDGRAQSAIVSRGLHVIAPDANTLPICPATSALDVRPGDAASLSGPACTDAEGDPLTLRQITAPAKGTVSYAGGLFIYHATAGETGTDHFSYVANDGFGDSAVSSVTMTILAPTAPRCSENNLPDDTTVFTGTPYVVSLYCGPGTAGPPIQMVIDSGPSHAASFSAERWSDYEVRYTYVPISGYTGPDSFTWHGVGPDGTASPTRTWSFTVSADTNRPPTCGGPNPLVVRADTTRAALITCVDHDAGDDNVLEVVTPPAHGQVIDVDDSNDGFITLGYDPDDSYEGLDRFTVRIGDGRGRFSAPITISASVIAADDNRAPTCFGTGASTTPGATRVLDRICSDPDQDPITYSILRQPAHGTAAINGDGNVTYTSDPGYNGNDDFDFEASDDHGAATPWTFSMQVGAVGPGSGGGGSGGGGGGSSAGNATAERAGSASDGAGTAGAPSPAGGGSPSPAPPVPTAASGGTPVPGLALGDATAVLTPASSGRTVTVSGVHPLTVMTLRCETTCTVLARPVFVLPGASARARVTTPRTVAGTLQRLKLSAGHSGKVVLRVPSAVRKRLGRTRTVTVRYVVSVVHADGTTSRGTTSFRVRLAP